MVNKTEKIKRESFVSTFGIIAATAGSAIGLGNIWRFPYITGENGGGAFLLIYLICVFAIGIPVMLSEMIIGRKGQANAFRAFKKLAPKSMWWIIGMMGVVAAFIILAFYSTVAGWTLQYLFSSLTFNLLGNEYVSYFQNFKESQIMPVVWQLVFMLLTALIVMAGINKGIEKYNKILMPLLFLIIIILCIRSLTLPGAKEGLIFLFNPDFSKVTSRTFLVALGQAFFSLSIGMGTIITYASYIKKNQKLATIATNVTVADFTLALLAGIMIFPAVFAFNIEPGSGPGLVFITLPTIFEQLPWGNIFAIIFFVLLTIAALTSSISVLEVVVAYFTEELKVGRKFATIFSSIAISIFGLFSTLSWSKFKDVGLKTGTNPETGEVIKMNIFEIMDFTASNILLPIGGLLIVIFVGWVLGSKKSIEELNLGEKKTRVIYKRVFFVIKFIAPIVIAFVFLNSIGLI